MKGRQKYTSLFLILVFVWVLVPPAALHVFFADHEDTVCEIEHDRTIAQVESLHTHCVIFSAQAPLYNAPTLVLLAKLVLYLISVLHANESRFLLQQSRASHFSRGPPFHK